MVPHLCQQALPAASGIVRFSPLETVQGPQLLCCSVSVADTVLCRARGGGGNGAKHRVRHRLLHDGRPRACVSICVSILLVLPRLVQFDVLRVGCGCRQTKCLVSAELTWGEFWEDARTLVMASRCRRTARTWRRRGHIAGITLCCLPIGA